jgi:hypothetical protein
MALRDWFQKLDRWFPYGRRNSLSSRGDLQKPYRETELPKSDEPENEERAAIERERQRRIADHND